MTAIMPIIISALSLLLAFVIAIISWINQGRDRIKDTTIADEQLKEGLMKANIKLDTLNTICNETRTDIRSLDTKIQGLDRRIVQLESDQKTLWKYVEELKEEVKERTD